MVGLSCSNIELKDAGWNTFLRKNECNLLIYNAEYQMVESSSRYQRGRTAMFGPCFLAPVTWLNVLADNQSRAFRGSLEYRAKSEIPVFQIPTGLSCGTR